MKRFKCLLLSPALMALRYVRKFPFCGCNRVFTQWAIWRIIRWEGR